jgi:ABC-type transporter MlaC component
MLVRVLAGLVLALALAVDPAAADSRAFVATLSTQAIATLATGDDAGRREAALRLLDRALDLEELARSTAGPAWDGGSPAERREFAARLADTLARLMARNGELYRVVRFAVTDARAGPDGVEVVGSEASRPGYRPIAIDWHVRADGEGYRLDDLVFAGLSARVLLRTAAQALALENGGGLAGLNAALARMATEPIALPEP